MAKFKYNKKSLLNLLKKWISAHPGIYPSKSKINKDKSMPDASTYVYYFGGWKEVLKSLNIKPRTGAIAGDPALRNKKSSYEKGVKRFFSRVIPVTESGCWLWEGTVNNKGYGCTSFDNKSIYAHRLSYMIYNGEIPEGLFVCHACDVPICVNPTHLWLGINKDNVNDMINKNRRPDSAGEKCSAAKLTNKQALEIYGSNEPDPILAKKYGVKSCTINNIKHGRSWRKITGQKICEWIEEQ